MPNSKHGNILGGATANASIPGAHANDVEASTNSNHIKVNLDDDRWIIDVNIDNIITKIVQHQTFADQLGSWWRKRLLGRNNPPNNFVGDPLESYRINFAVLQRIHISQLRVKLIRNAVDLRFKARQPPGWADNLQQYIQALKDYEYMSSRHHDADDPFYVSGTRYNDRALLAHYIGPRGSHQILRTAAVSGPWETRESTDTKQKHDTRTENYRRSWMRGFYERVGVAALSGAFLIAPMWLMVLHKTLYTGLISTTGFVAVFGLTAAAFLRHPTEVVACTAAYAAVLVVFVGLTTENAAD